MKEMLALITARLVALLKCSVFSLQSFSAGEIKDNENVVDKQATKAISKTSLPLLNLSMNKPHRGLKTKFTTGLNPISMPT